MYVDEPNWPCSCIIGGIAIQKYYIVSINQLVNFAASLSHRDVTFMRGGVTALRNKSLIEGIVWLDVSKCPRGGKFLEGVVACGAEMW